ncbi:hypothetical protein FHQ08_00515 [Lactobacillus sp. CC-MHH1034]|uniref:hypothetical protein n=1 Tax=Agrilactobacillus fermenti TaxID=2586909 RepID=UPI001E340395|nr:hypothetical protein [Agrilactobacillus fermenti]MCD2255190.1 hypothetical protein [Agrilactobacillus fermenti]
MTTTKQVSALQFIGKPFLPSMLDEKGSLASAWLEMADDGSLDRLDQFALEQQQTLTRATLVAFSPYSFVAWIGGIFSAEIQAPTEFKNIVLPASEVAFNETPTQTQIWQLPLNSIVGLAMDKLEKQHVQLPNHLGQTDKPYFLEYYDLNPQFEVTKLTQYIYLGKETNNGDETYYD